MISLKKLIKLARKWHHVAAAAKRKKISLQRINDGMDDAEASKGHFVVYSLDGRRFVVPLVYLNNSIFRELFKMSEDEFGLPSEGPITLPCDSTLMDYIISFIQGHAFKDLETALLLSLPNTYCSKPSSFHYGQTNEQLLLSAC